MCNVKCVMFNAEYRNYTLKFYIKHYKLKIKQNLTSNESRNLRDANSGSYFVSIELLIINH